MSPDAMWRLADVIDIVHVFIVVPLLVGAAVYAVVGKNEKVKDIVGIACFSLVAVQASIGNCPLTVLSWELRRVSDPNFAARDGDVLYNAYHWLNAEAPYVRWIVLFIAFGGISICLYDLITVQQRKTAKAPQVAA